MLALESFSASSSASTTTANPSTSTNARIAAVIFASYRGPSKPFEPVLRRTRGRRYDQHLAAAIGWL
jgi:hypothetical protein